MSKPDSVDFEDIQGLTRFSHAHLGEAAYMLVNIRDAKSAREWIRSAPITSADKQDPRPASALQLAISVTGLRALEIPDSIINQFSNEFIDGMADGNSRSRRLGDIGVNSPEKWSWGNPASGTPNMLIMLFSDKGKLEEDQAEIQNKAFTKAFSVTKVLTSNRCDGREPFGFRDGISQPTIDWQQTVSTDLHDRDDYSNLVALGEIVLGYPNEYGLYTDRPLISAQAAPGLPPALDNNDSLEQFNDLGRHGTYLVMRQLEQDVAGFWRFVEEHSDLVGQTTENLAAAMVGRHIDGEPLVETDKHSIDGIEENSKNNFTYNDDPLGNQCPIGSHVRRANPRTGDFPVGVRGFLSRLVKVLGFKRNHPKDDLISSTRFHRILRRGRPYGPCITSIEALQENSPRADTGLHFICLGANISRQFEFVQNAWLSSSNFAGLSGERDPLVGTREPLNNGMPTDSFTQSTKNQPARCINQLPQFVTTQGGGYFFMPGLAALQYLASEPNLKQGTEPS